MTDKEQCEENRQQIVQTIAYEVIQAHRNGEGALTPKQLLDKQVRAGARKNAAEYIAAIKGVGKYMEYHGLFTNTGTDDEPAWAPTDQLLEMP